MQCKECFKFIFFRGEKTEIFSENRPQNEMPLVSPTGKDSPTGGPRHRSDEHEHQLYHCPVTLSQLYHCPGHSVLNECAPKQLDLSAERVAGVNTNSHAEVVSAGLQ